MQFKTLVWVLLIVFVLRTVAEFVDNDNTLTLISNLCIATCCAYLNYQRKED